MTNQVSSEDKDFIRALEALEIAPDDFDHRSHIRMAYSYLCEYDVPTTCRRVRRVLFDVLTHNGIDPTSKYHETMTQSWTLIVRHFMAGTPGTTSAAQFVDACPYLLPTVQIYDQSPNSRSRR